MCTTRGPKLCLKFFTTDGLQKKKKYCVDVSLNALRGLMFEVTTKCLLGSIKGSHSLLLFTSICFITFFRQRPRTHAVKHAIQLTLKQNT